MINLKKDYERNIQLVKEQMLSYHCSKLSAAETSLPTKSPFCQGYISSFVWIMHFVWISLCCNFFP